MQTRHIIKRLILDVHFTGYNQQEARFETKRLTRLINTSKVYSKLNALFNAVSPNGTIMSIPRIELDLGNITSTELNSELIERIEKAFRAVQHQSRWKREFIPINIKLEEVLVYFLRYGTLPWYSPVSSIAQLEKSILEKDDIGTGSKLTGKIVQLFKDPRVCRRFSEQFSREFFIYTLQQGPKLPTRIIKKYKQLSKLIPDREQHSLIQQKILVIQSQGGDMEKFLDSVLTAAIKKTPGLKKIIRDAGKKTGDSYKETPEDSDNQIPEDEGILIVYAGIVLLHPFLKQLFVSTRLLKEEIFGTSKKQDKAVHILYYLATGKTDPEEHETTLLKCLCGMDIYFPLEKRSDLTAKMKQEADQCLKAAIGHWKALKNTSIDGLRETFIQRSGRLKINNNGYTLDVEKKGMDILLEKLPWSVGFVKLPWMDQPLLVNW